MRRIQNPSLAVDIVKMIEGYVLLYNAELDAQMISPNGDDFNTICEAMLAYVNCQEPPRIKISPANR